MKYIFYIYFKYFHCPIFGHNLKKHRIRQYDSVPEKLPWRNGMLLMSIGIHIGYYLIHCDRCGYWELLKTK